MFAPGIKNMPYLIGTIHFLNAETRGFEPPGPYKRPTSLAKRHVRPLRHVSILRHMRQYVCTIPYDLLMTNTKFQNLDIKLLF